jgi:hypothetical protein
MKSPCVYAICYFCHQANNGFLVHHNFKELVGELKIKTNL